MDQDVLAKVLGGLHYEERQLAMLMLLRLPNTRVVFVSSTPIEPAIVDYYLGLLPGSVATMRGGGWCCCRPATRRRRR